MSRRARKKIRRIRGAIPKFECIGGCSDCCGPVAWNRWEIEQLEVVKDVLGPNCPYSTPGGCEVYVHRPVVCRLFGAAEGMDCPHGRRPPEKLTRDRSQKLTAAYWDLPDFKVLGIDGWLNRNCDQERLQQVLDQIRSTIQDEE
jgi:Fe-S-cluster containining protein